MPRTFFMDSALEQHEFTPTAMLGAPYITHIVLALATSCGASRSHLDTDGFPASVPVPYSKKKAPERLGDLQPGLSFA